MIKTQYITLNMVPSGVLPVLYCSQYDIGRPLGMVVYNGGEAVDLDSYTVTIEATRSDGTAITVAVTTDGNVGAFVTTATMTNQADKYLAKMVIVDSSENRVASLAFVMCITPKTMDENAESIEEDRSLYQQYTTAVQALIAEVREDLAATNEDLAAESVARAAGDSTLSGYINDEAAARELADTEIGRRFNDFYYINLERITTLAIPSGYILQGGCYKDGYLYCIYHVSNTNPLMIGKFDLSTGALLDSFQVSATGHGNGVSNFVDDLILVCDSYTNMIYMVDVVQKQVRHSVSNGNAALLSSIAVSQNGKKIVLQTGGQNALTGYYQLPYAQSGYDNVWYQEYLFNDIPAKSTALVQDMTFAKNIWLCCLNTNGYANQEKRKNCIRVFGTNGIHNRDIYFDNSLEEPECITYDTSDDKLIIVDYFGGVYKTVNISGVFDSSYFGRSIATINLTPAVQLDTRTNQTATYTDSVGTHSIDMRFPICEGGFASGSGDASSRVRDHYVLQASNNVNYVYSGILSPIGAYIIFRTERSRVRITYRYAIVDNAYAELTQVAGTYIDGDGITTAFTTVTRGDSENDAAFMSRIITALAPVYESGALTNPLNVTIHGDNKWRYPIKSIALPTA